MSQMEELLRAATRESGAEVSPGEIRPLDLSGVPFDRPWLRGRGRRRRAPRRGWARVLRPGILVPVLAALAVVAVVAASLALPRVLASHGSPATPSLRVPAGGTVAIGLALPTWAIVLAQAAIPPRRHTEAILHARAFSPEEAFERHIVHGVARPAERVVEEARAAAAPLAALDQKAYAISKSRHRAMVVKWAVEQLEAEIGALPSRATVK